MKPANYKKLYNFGSKLHLYMYCALVLPIISTIVSYLFDFTLILKWSFSTIIAIVVVYMISMRIINHILQVNYNKNNPN